MNEDANTCIATRWGGETGKKPRQADGHPHGQATKLEVTHANTNIHKQTTKEQKNECDNTFIVLVQLSFMF